MTDSPATRTPYEVLGVGASATESELRRAYRRLLRSTHPDTGGDPVRFHEVQQAWSRIGDKESRRRWDAGHTSRDARSHVDADYRADTAPASSRKTSTGSSVRARTYGHPGGFARERFLVLMREWSGRGDKLVDPYDAALVRSAPREIRRLLAGALAEEATARAISGLGIGYTVWSDVATDRGKLDHVVLGPAGLFALMSEDWGGPVRLVRGELVGEGIALEEQPVRDLARRARWLGRHAHVRFTATLIVVPDGSLDEPFVRIGKKNDAAIVGFSVLPRVLRDGLRDDQRLSIEDVFDVRTRLQQSIHFV